MKNAIVTGASSGIGAQICRNLARDGYRPHLLGRNQERLAKVAAECSTDSQFYSFDFQNIESVKAFSQKWLKENPSPLKALVINAGNIERQSFINTPLEEWQQQFYVSVLGPVALIKEFMPRIIQDQTQIVTIASTLGLKPIADTSAYSALKAAMVNWSSSLANELAPHGVRVNCVCPGIIETPIHGTTDESWHKGVNELVPLGRSGQPQDVAEMVCYLLSDKAQWITGTQQVIDGGLFSLR